MRSAKTLLKMTKDAREMLPSWFVGEVYELGDEVREPYTGETLLLDAAELSMYDAIMGAQMAIALGLPMIDLDEMIDITIQGRDWFLAKNPNAYYILFS